MTRALPINPIRPMIPKKTGTTMDTIRSSGHSVVSFIWSRSAASSHKRTTVEFDELLHMVEYIINVFFPTSFNSHGESSNTSIPIVLELLWIKIKSNKIFGLNHSFVVLPDLFLITLPLLPPQIRNDVFCEALGINGNVHLPSMYSVFYL